MGTCLLVRRSQGSLSLDRGTSSRGLGFDVVGFVQAMKFVEDVMLRFLVQRRRGCLIRLG